MFSTIWSLHLSVPFPHFLHTLPQIHWSLCQPYHMAFIPVPLWNILSTYLSDALARFTILCIHVCLHAFLRHYCAKFPEEGAVEEQPSSQLLSYYPCSPHLLNVLQKLFHLPPCSTSCYTSALPDITPFY